MTVRESHRLKLKNHKYKSFYESLKNSLFTETKKRRQTSSEFKRMKKRFQIHKDVRSLQRLNLPKDWNAKDVALEYMRWLPEHYIKAIQIKQNGDEVRFSLFGVIDLLILHLSRERSTLDRSVFYIKGGLLVREPIESKGRLEFREIDGKDIILSAIHDFRPSLPWAVYKFTQAPFHMSVISAFHKNLNGKTEKLS